ncbi:MAG: glycosyltransferase, partial [Clostridia bacterium]|nr:glycosyltransferase [Clostridia bacterium]
VEIKINYGPSFDYELPVPDFDAKFTKELEKSELDIVHIHSPFAIGRIGVDYAAKHNIPAIVTMHSQYKMDFYKATKSKFLTNQLLKNVMLVYNRCDEYYAVNSKIAEVYYDYGSKHMPKVQRNGTDLLPVENEAEAIKTVNEKFGIKPETPVFLFVGRINAIKNIFFIVDSLALLKDVDYKMLFVGDGQDMEKLEKHVRKLGIEDKVVLTGKIMDRNLLQAIYLRAKLFLFPSVYDASSLVQIEASSQKTPTLFIRGSATSSTVTENVNGYMSEAKTESFAEKIREILADEELYQTVANNAFKDLYITWDDCVKEMYEKYLYQIERYARKVRMLQILKESKKRIPKRTPAKHKSSAKQGRAKKQNSK